MKRVLLLAFIALSIVFSLSPLVLGEVDGEESALITLINEYRQQNGVGALVLSSALTGAAEFHSQWMADHNCFSHQCPGEPSLGERLRDANYDWQRAVAENIAAGRADAEAIFRAWWSSSGHNQNMLDSHWKAIGISRVYSPNSTYGWYWTADFGDVNDTEIEPDPVEDELEIINTALPNGKVWDWYSYRMSAEGGAKPYRWSARALPRGLWISSRTGRIWGRPLRSGAFNVTVQVRNSQGERALKEFSVIIAGKKRASGEEANVNRESLQGCEDEEWLGELITATSRREIESIEVRVFDLAGQEVLFDQQRGATGFIPRLLSSKAEPLANGVYLYVVTVRGDDGQTIRSDVRKLVILR